MNKELRVRKNEEFQKIIGKKSSVVNKSFVLYYMKNNLGHMRVGLSVSKKLGKAVVRNKIKRQVRHMVRTTFNSNLSYDFVIIVRNKFLDNSFEQNKLELEKLLKKVQKKGEKHEF